ncbi:MAG: hypothetical protein QN174_00960 [Armatimonadota bacterium]|nr:hypothetical protein [Armatimonadota bacterium]MDR7421060.1 hypothetical protein [Armatimonadota bacterium]MDR7453191.1 hypothetical protein [Armatimonadota bacterium]MDR7456851.1 hypothetical protein [Armatimonadota bacterium]MDR7495518.1 hypothetical protein [Armatimonadota bacterium]
MRTLAITLVATALILGTSLPAAAQNTNFQTTFQLRYWGAGFGSGAGAITATDSASTWGGTLRLDSRTSPWSFSGRYDSMSVTPSAWPFTSAYLWDANVHYRFGGGTLDQYFGLFAGYGSVSAFRGDTAVRGTGSGFRIGAEFLVRQPGGFYFTADGAYGPSWSTTIQGFTGTAAGNVTDFKAALGYEMQSGVGLELGWRVVNWTIPTSPGCPSGCNFQFSGVVGAVTIRR